MLPDVGQHNHTKGIVRDMGESFSKWASQEKDTLIKQKNSNDNIPYTLLFMTSIQCSKLIFSKHMFLEISTILVHGTTSL